MELLTVLLQSIRRAVWIAIPEGGGRSVQAEIETGKRWRSSEGNRKVQRSPDTYASAAFVVCQGASDVQSRSNSLAATEAEQRREHF